MSDDKILVISDQEIEVVVDADKLRGKTPEEAKVIINEALAEALAKMSQPTNSVDKINVGIDRIETAKALQELNIHAKPQKPPAKKQRTRQLRAASMWPRNALCFCHSGKKYKNCCLLTMKGLK